MSHILLATPDHLHGLADRFGGNHGCTNEIDLEPPAETATEQGGVDLDLLRLETYDGGGRGLRDRLGLRRCVDVSRVGAHIGGAALRLKCGVRQHRQFVRGTNDFSRPLQRGGGVAIVADGAAVAGRRFAQPCADSVVVERSIGAGVPLDLHGAERLVGLPVVIGDHHDPVIGTDDVLHAGHGLGLRRIEARECAAEGRALRKGAVQHARELHVDAVDGSTVEFARGVEAFGGLADQREFFGRLQRDLGRHRQLGCRFGKLAEGQALATVDHRTRVDLERVRSYAPLRGCRLHEHAAGLRARLAQLLPGVTHAGAAAGDLRAEQVVGVHDADGCRLDADRLESHSEFLGEQLRERGVHALTHLGFIDKHRDGVVTGDAQPGDGLSASTDRRRFAAATESDAEHEAAAGQYSEFQKVATRVVGERIGFSVHHAFSFLSSSAARCTALRMRL